MSPKSCVLVQKNQKSGGVQSEHSNLEVVQTTKNMSLSLEHLFVREFERKDDKILKISQSGLGDVGCVVWDAAIVLASYLETGDFSADDGRSLLTDKTVLELGSGTGLVGLQAACMG